MSQDNGQDVGEITMVDLENGRGFLESCAITYSFRRLGVVDGREFRSMRKGDFVEFDPVDTGAGPRAVNIRICR